MISSPCGKNPIFTSGPYKAEVFQPDTRFFVHSEWTMMKNALNKTKHSPFNRKMFLQQIHFPAMLSGLESGFQIPSVKGSVFFIFLLVKFTSSNLGKCQIQAWVILRSRVRSCRWFCVVKKHLCRIPQKDVIRPAFFQGISSGFAVALRPFYLEISRHRWRNV